MNNRVARHQTEEVDRAVARVRLAVGQPLDSQAEMAIRFAVDQAYIAGANWGEQDGYREAEEEYNARR